jgi:hypothetical protein
MEFQNAQDGTETAVSRAEFEQLLSEFGQFKNQVQKHLGLSPLNAPRSSVSDPGASPHPSSRDQKSSHGLDLEARYTRLAGLFDHMMTIKNLKGRFGPIRGDDNPRIYFSDNTFLWYGNNGKLYASPKDRPNSAAQIAIANFGLDKKIFKPAPVDKHDRPHFKGQSVACPTPGAVMCKSGFRKPKKKWD